MSESKYNHYWKNKTEIIQSALKLAALHNQITSIHCADIKTYGVRNNWGGTVVVGDGIIVKRGEMAHMKSLGVIIAPFTFEYPKKYFRLTMSNGCDLIIKLMQDQESTQPDVMTQALEEVFTLPNSCKELHEYVWELERYRYPFNFELLPHDGVYFCFETGETAHNGDRITRVGINRENGNLRDRIKKHFVGDCSNSIFRRHVKDAIESKTKRECSEAMISEYIQGFISIAVIKVNSPEGRKRLEREALETLSKCNNHTPNSLWLGINSPNSVIRSSGLWNEQGVQVHRVAPSILSNHHTLILIPCSANKTLHRLSSFSLEEQDTIFTHLTPETSEMLNKARKRVNSIANIKIDTKPNTAIDLYDGFLYNVHGFRREVCLYLAQASSHLAIISGGYGIVLPNEKIHLYECNLSETYAIWIQGGLPKVIEDLVTNWGIKNVVGFFGRRTPYFKMMKKIGWSKLDPEKVKIYSPNTYGKAGLLKKVPRFLGEAALTFMQSKCDFRSLDYFTAEGLEIIVNDLK